MIRAEYESIDGDQVYFVLHSGSPPSRGGVLLVGSAPFERGYSSGVWNRWADRLADAGFDVLRFDFRCVGESTGNSAQMTLAHWVEDALTCFGILQERSTATSLAIHGLRFGALIAAHLFTSGHGNALLLWDPPASGQAVLKAWIGARLAEDAATPGEVPRRSRAQLREALEREGAISACGYHVTCRLAREIEALSLELAPDHDPRPVHSVRLISGSRTPESSSDNAAFRIPTPPFWRASPFLRPDLGDLFEHSIRWLRAVTCEAQSST